MQHSSEHLLAGAASRKTPTSRTRTRPTCSSETRQASETTFVPTRAKRNTTSGSRFRFAVLPPLLIAKVMVWGFVLGGAADPARRVFCFPGTTSSSLLSLTPVGGFPSWCCHKSFILILITITVIAARCAPCLLALGLFDDDRDEGIGCNRFGRAVKTGGSELTRSKICERRW